MSSQGLGEEEARAAEQLLGWSQKRDRERKGGGGGGEQALSTAVGNSSAMGWHLHSDTWVTAQRKHPHLGYWS